MPGWITHIQGIREILNSAGTALTRRKLLQFGAGFTAQDDGSKTVVTLGNPSSAYAANLAPLLRGVGLTVDSTGKLRPKVRPRRVPESDHFISGGTASGSIGKLGWSLLGTGTPAYARLSISAVNSARKCSVSTSATTNNRSTLCLGDTESRTLIAASEIATLQCAWNMNNSLTNKRVFFGLMGDFATEPSAAAECLGVYYDSAVSPNYQIIARTSSSGSPVVSASAVAANVDDLMTIHQGTAGSYEFRVNNTALGTISSGVPAGGLNVGFRVETLTTAAAVLRLGYFGIEGNDTVAGALDNDTFLEV